MDKSIEEKIDYLEKELLVLEGISMIRFSINGNYVDMLKDFQNMSKKIDRFLINYNSSSIDYHHVDKDYVLSIWLNVLERYKLLLYFYRLFLDLLSINNQIDYFEEALDKASKLDALEYLKEYYQKTLKDINHLSYLKNDSQKLSAAVNDEWDAQIVDSTKGLKSDFIGTITSYYTVALFNLCTIFNISGVIERYIKNGDFQNKKDKSIYIETKEHLETFTLDIENKCDELLFSISKQMDILDKYFDFLGYINYSKYNKNK